MNLSPKRTTCSATVLSANKADRSALVNFRSSPPLPNNVFRSKSMRQRNEVFANLDSEQIISTLEACSLEDKQEFTEDESARIEYCRSLVEQQGKTYKQAAAQFRKQDKLKASGDAQANTNALEISELLAKASEQVGARISLIEAGKFLSACDLPDKEQYDSQECDRFVEACTLIKQQGKTYEEVAAHFGITQQSKVNAHRTVLEEVRQLLSQPAFSQAEQIREALPQMAVEQLEEIKALFWQMTAQRLRQYVDSGQLEAEIRTASKSVLATNSGNSLGLLNPSSSPNQKRLPG